jgi:hypothetical protein
MDVDASCYPAEKDSRRMPSSIVPFGLASARGLVSRSHLDQEIPPYERFVF